MKESQLLYPSGVKSLFSCPPQKNTLSNRRLLAFCKAKAEQPVARRQCTGDSICKAKKPRSRTAFLTRVILGVIVLALHGAGR